MSSPHADRNRLWKKIGDEFRQACLLRREGRGEEATEMLEKRLPETIGAWARQCGLREPERRERLNELFEREQQRVDDIWLSQQIVLRQMRDILIPSLCLQVAEEVREVMELQVEQITSAIARMQAPVPSAAAPVEAPRPAASSERPVSRPQTNIVPWPQVTAVERRAQPNFDDLPAIIDELIGRDLRGVVLNARAAALV